MAEIVQPFHQYDPVHVQLCLQALLVTIWIIIYTKLISTVNQKHQNI